MPTPDELAYLLQYGRDTSQLGMRNTQAPGHWTQALAGALQMGIGGHYGAKGTHGIGQGKMDANKRLADLLASGADPRQAATSLLNDPWSAEHGQKLAMQELDPMTALNRKKAQLGISNLQSEAAMAPLRRQKMQMELDASRLAIQRQRMMDDMVLGTGQPQGSQPQAPVDVPAQGAARFSAPAVAPQQPKQQTLRDLVQAQTPDVQAMFKALWLSGDRKGALELIQKQTVDDLSKQTIPGVDAEGNTVLIQTSASGKAKTAELPKGVKVDFGARKGAELSAKAMTGLRFGMPKAAAALRSLEQQHAIVERSLAQAEPMINALSTGLSGALLKDLPQTEAYNLARLLDTIKANIGFDALNAMRQNSPTGGALGNVTERELAFLQATMGSLDQAQTVGQLVDIMGQIKENFRISKDIRHRAFQEEFAPLYGGQPAPLPELPRMNFAPTKRDLGDGFSVEVN